MMTHIHRGLTDQPCDICQQEIAGYIIEAEDLDTLRNIASKLHGGSDKERDLGHKLWLIVNVAEEVPITIAELDLL